MRWAKLDGGEQGSARSCRSSASRSRIFARIPEGFVGVAQVHEHPILDGIALDSVPPVLGHNITKPRAGCEVVARIASCEPIVRRGASFFGAFDGNNVLGLAVVDASFEPPLAWLAYLHVSRSHRRHGVATTLWGAAVDTARAAGATAMYVSATPTGSAVGFYLSRGCRLADPVHPALYADEPDDIHLICPIS